MLIVGGNQSAAGYDIDNSLRFNDGSSDYLYKTFSTPTNNKKYTFSSWIKRGSNLDSRTTIFGAGSDGNNENYIGFNTDNTFYYFVYSHPNQYRYVSSGVYKDVSAWYHCVVAVDTTLADANDRVILYINGERIAIGTQQDIPQNYDSRINSAVNHGVGYAGNTSFPFYWDGYQAETVFIDGQQLDPTSFGEFDEDSGIWKPIDVSGLTFGTNGFYLDFENSGSLGADVSGNGNNFTVNNLTSIDQTTDTPTNNFATYNILLNGTATWSPTFSDGNLSVSFGADDAAISNFGVSQGKWYCEVKCTNDAANPCVGMSNESGIAYTNPGTSNLSGTGECRYLSTGTKRGFGSGDLAYGSSWTTNDIIGMAVDLDNNAIWFSKNGVWQNSATITEIQNGTTTNAAFTGFSGIFFIGGSCNAASGTTGDAFSVNFGNAPYTIASGNSDANGYGNFEYTVPSGFYALCTKNLAEYG